MPRRAEQKLTARRIERLRTGFKVGSSREIVAADSVCPGLSIQIRPSGHAVYRLRYLRPVIREGVTEIAHRSLKLGDVTGAPHELEEIRAEALKIKDRLRKDPRYDPFTERDETEREAQRERDTKDTFKDIAANYIERVAKKHLRTWADNERIFRVYVEPEWGSRRLPAIARRDMASLLDKIEDTRGPVMADRVLAAVRRLFNWYAGRDDDFVSPVVKGMARTKPKERARDRVLTDEEIKAIWGACDTAEPPIFGKMVKMLFLTAQRRGEVAEMRWSEIEGETWTIPAERYKTKRANTVPLSKLAQTLLASITRHEGSDFVFTLGNATSRPKGDEDTDKQARPFGNFGEAKAALDKTSGVSKFTLHDIRRTAKTLMQRAGVRPDISERVLGHVISGVAGVYDRHDYLPEKRHALEALASAIGEALKSKEKKDKKIISYRPRRTASASNP